MVRSSLRLLGILFVVVLQACKPTTDGGQNGQTDGSQLQKLYGLNFSPYLRDQDPNLGAQVGEEQLRSRLEIIAPHVRWIRTFGSTNGLEAAGRIAHDLGLETAIGAWLGPDPEANEEGMLNLIAAARAGEVNVAVVGSEALLREDLTPQQLIEYVNRVRDAIPESIPVTTAEVCGVLLDNPSIIDAVDVVFANHYSFWEGVALDGALDALYGCYEQLVTAAGGKPVVISETGWPTCGNQVGSAVPGLENARTYLHGFVSWARTNQVPFFYFEAFDEAWKAKYEGPQGACWGLWDEDGELKPGVEEIFAARRD